MRKFIAIVLSKLIHFILRLFNRGATSFPGLVALKIDKNILKKISKNTKTIIVTGTNGKTTSCRMISEILKENNVSFFENKSGANLKNGIVTEYVLNSTVFGKNKYEYALIECDEAAFKTVSTLVDPKYILVTNVFRDQLDRYGEISNILENIKIGILNSKNAIVCLNADDSITSSLKDEIDNKVFFYGINVPIYKNRVNEASDALYCIRCKHPYKYKYITYGHLGDYYCDNCGYHRITPNISVERLISSDADSSNVEIKYNDELYEVNINLPGGYNIYNALGSLAVSKVINLDINKSIIALSKFESGFGRMEKFVLDGVNVRMILIKNPAGCNQVLNFLSNLEEDSNFVILLNDKYADGTDISWIWDVDFEVLNSINSKIKNIYVSGIRKDDMALRLKYAGFNNIKVIESYEELIRESIKDKLDVYIMPTYTSMMDLRSIISKKYGYKDFWE